MNDILYDGFQGVSEPGEDDLTAALRETLEETGLEPGQLRVFTEVMETRRFGRSHRETYFLAMMQNFDEEICLSEEHIDYKWMTTEEAIPSLHFPTRQHILKALNTRLIKMEIPYLSLKSK